MKISTILNHIDSGHMALPEFQRGYVWNRDQVRGLFDSLNRRHPVGGLLVWVTESATADHRGEGGLAPGVVKLLLDGQQRITTLYGVVRGRPPKFFDGRADTFTGLRFHLATQEFSFWQPVKMRDDPLWIDLTEVFAAGADGIGPMIKRLSAMPEVADDIGTYVSRLGQILGILDIDLHVEEVTGPDKTIDTVVDIFNRVNSGGTKLSKGDLALAKICAEWPEARGAMKDHIARWRDAGFNFSLDWLLRSVNTVLTGEAKFQYLHDKSSAEVEQALASATKRIDTVLNQITGRLGLDHDRVLFGRFALPVMVRYLEQTGGHLDAASWDKLLFWYLQTGMWGRYSATVETYIDQDIAALEREGSPLDNLLEHLSLWQGSFSVQPNHFAGYSLGARFYPVLYMLTRMGEARDWDLGIPLRNAMVGKGSKLEVHHIFPKARLYEAGYQKTEVNSLANFCFQTKDSNLWISDKPPSLYFREVEAKHPGALASQWIPMDPSLWEIENYPQFLAARRELLAKETNRHLASLLHGDLRWLDSASVDVAPIGVPQEVPGGVGGPDEEAELESVRSWLDDHRLPQGEIAYQHRDTESDLPTVVLDLAWPTGLQEGLSQPVCLLLNESADVVAAASAAGYRCFTTSESLIEYVEREVLGEQVAA